MNIERNNTYDIHFMKMALSLAEQGKTSCQPNPRVGCVLTQGDRVIGEGFHQTAGMEHAEINAIQNAWFRGESISGATAYVTLEPCSHTGKTPPCVDALINEGVSRVVIATEDPNPKVSGQGITKLRQQAIEVELIQDEAIQSQAEHLNKAFFFKMRTGKPYVVLKTATTLDGRTADSIGESQWITGDEARNDVHQLRAESCAVLTGAGTQRLDNPRLTARVPGIERQPYRILLDSNLSVEAARNIVGDDQRLIVFSEQDESTVPLSLKSKLNAYYPVARANQVAKENTLDLSQVMDVIADLEINQLMIEAGATLSGSFVELGLVDEIVHYIAPSILGEKGRAAFNFGSAVPFDQRLNYDIVSSEIYGKDLKVIYRKAT